MRYQGNTQSNVKQTNQNIIMDLLIERGPITRADMAKIMNASKPTISKNINELIQNKRVLEIGKQENTLGKKGILLDINADYEHILAIDLSKGRLRLAFSNLKKQILEYSESTIQQIYNVKGSKYDQSNQAVHTSSERVIIDRIDQFVLENADNYRRVKHIVISYPGVVDEHGNIYFTNSFNERSLLEDVVHHVIANYQKHIIIKNDINLGVLAIKEYTAEMGNKNLCLLSGDMGVAIGIMIDNQLYEGDRFAAGEIGFILPKKQPDGMYYSIEDRIGIPALIRRYNKKGERIDSYQELTQRINQQDPVAIRLYRKVIDDIVVAIINVASILDIEKVFLTGRLFELKADMVAEINKKVADLTPFHTNVSYSTVDNKSLKGAIIIGVQAALEGKD